MVGQSNGSDRSDTAGDSLALTTAASAIDFQLIDTAAGPDPGPPNSIADGGSAYTDAASGTIILAPYQNPIRRRLQWYGDVPYNDWGGEAHGAGIFGQVHAESSGFAFVYHSDAVSGAALSFINVGTHPWNYLLQEVAEAKARAPDAGFPTYFVPAVGQIHGEADCQNVLIGSQWLTYQANMRAALLAITGNRPGPGRCPTCIPLLVLQVNCTCGLLGPEYAATEQLTIAQDPANQGKIVAVGPTYPLPFSFYMVHRTNYGHREGAALMGEAYLAYEQWQQNGGPYPLPVAPVKVGAFNSSGIQASPDPATFSRAGNVVTINFATPANECLVADSSHFPTLHGATSAFPMWSGGLGFEGWVGVNPVVDGGMPGVQHPSFQHGTPISTTCAITGCSQVQCTFSQPPEAIAYAFTPDANTLIDGGSYDGGNSSCNVTSSCTGETGPPNGNYGWIRTTYSKVDTFGDPLPLQHWAWQFIQGGPF